MELNGFFIEDWNCEACNNKIICLHLKKSRQTSLHKNCFKLQIPPVRRFLGEVKSEVTCSKEEIFGQYVASELKRIKSKKTYEEVKWKILQALQSAAEREADDPDALDM